MVEEEEYADRLGGGVPGMGSHVEVLDTKEGSHIQADVVKLKMKYQLCFNCIIKISSVENVKQLSGEGEDGEIAKDEDLLNVKSSFVEEQPSAKRFIRGIRNRLSGVPVIGTKPSQEFKKRRLTDEYYY